MIDDHPSRELLAAFDRGLLPSPHQSEVERHVSGCTSCCQLLESIGDDDLVALIKTAAAPANSPLGGSVTSS